MNGIHLPSTICAPRPASPGTSSSVMRSPSRRRLGSTARVSVWTPPARQGRGRSFFLDLENGCHRPQSVSPAVESNDNWTGPPVENVGPGLGRSRLAGRSKNPFVTGGDAGIASRGQESRGPRCRPGSRSGSGWRSSRRGWSRRSAWIASAFISSTCQRRMTRALLTAYGPILPSSERNRTRSSSSPPRSWSRRARRASANRPASARRFAASGRATLAVVGHRGRIKAVVRLPDLDPADDPAIVERDRQGVIALLDRLVRLEERIDQVIDRRAWRRCFPCWARPAHRPRRWRGT